MRTWFNFLNWPLRAKLAALLVVASLLPLTIAAIIDIRGTRERMLENAAALLSARGDQLANQLDAFHRGYQHSIDRFAHLPAVTAYCQSWPEDAEPPGHEMRSTMDVWPASDSYIRGVALLDLSGRIRAATEGRLVGVDLSNRHFAREALHATGVVTADIYSADGAVNPTIAYFAPVRRTDGRVTGVVAFWVRATALWEMMKASNELAGPSSFAVLFDRQGIRMGHTYDGDIVFHPGGRLDPATLDTLVAERRFGDKTRALLEDVRAFPEQFDRARAESPGQGIFHGFAPVNQKWSYGVGRRMVTVPWTVFYMMPEQTLEAQIGQMTRRKILFAAGIILGALVGGSLFALVILRPVAALARATQAIAGGDLTARVNATQADELGRLGASFDAMAERIEGQATALQKGRDELGVRVRERTAELEKTTRDLEAENAERKRAERAGRESQQLLEAIIDNSAAVIYVKDLQGRYLLVNRRYEEIFHLTRDAILGKTDHDLFPREAADAFRAMDQQVVAGGVPVTDEEVAPQQDGPHTYVSVKCPLRDPEGRICGVFGISTDITEHKRAEDAFRASQQLLRGIVESSDDAIISKDLAGIITSWNPGAEKLFGFPAAEAIGQPMQMLIPPERAHEEPEILARITRGETTDHFETVRVRKDGTRVDISATISPVKDGQGRIVGASKIARDITERKQAETKLRAQLARLDLLSRITRAIAERQDVQSIFQAVIRSVEESLPVDFSCVCLYDAADQAVTVTSVGVHSGALAMELAMVEHARIDIDQNGLSRCVRGQLVYEPDVRSVPFPFPQRLARGGLRALVAAPLLVESKVFGLLVAARRQPGSFSSGECEFLKQVTEHVALASNQAQIYGALQQAYEDLRQTQQAIMQQERLRALGQMASGIAHDINNAISPVALYTESLLEREPHLSAKGREYLRIIQHAIEDVAQTVSRMREFYRQREPQLVLGSVDLNRLAGQVTDLTRARWSDMPQQRGIVIELRQELAAGLPAVMAVESEIREALINLVFNAVDAMPEGGTLTLRTRPVEGGESDRRPQVEVQVADTGVGMDEATRRRCLEPFFTTKGERGTGLGLAMVYGTVQRHSAELVIDSTPGRGTTVSLRFALPAASTAEAGPASEDARPAGRLRLLLVDDDPLLIKSLRDTLEGDGHEILWAMGGQEGIAAFAAARHAGNPFAAVITDLGMPHVDGRQVARAIKAASPATPVILLTGWGQRLVAEGDVPPHVDRVLNKPPKLRELRAALAAVTSPSPDA